MRLSATGPHTAISHTLCYGSFRYHCFFSNSKFSHRCLKTVIRDSVLDREKGKKAALSALSFSFSFHAAFIGEPLEKESEFNENAL